MEEVICIRTHDTGVIKYSKGEEYPLFETREDCCGTPLNIGLKLPRDVIVTCSDCGHVRESLKGEIYWVDSRDFVPKSNITELEVLHQEKEIEELIRN